jgi:competence protein ComFC
MTLLDLLFPRRCIGCGKVGKYFCRECRLRIKCIEKPICPVCQRPAIDGATHPVCQTKYTLDGLTSFFQYTGIIQKAIKTLKYRFVTDLVSEFINLIPFFLFNNRAIEPLSNAIIIPIPLHSSRLRFRGFNQAEVLGRFLAKRLNIPFKTNILKRIRKTTPQVEMKDRKKRLTNMENVFSVTPNILISQYPNILLLDDVFTTGATLRSAATVLKRAGAKRVWGLVLAHGN